MDLSASDFDKIVGDNMRLFSSFFSKYRLGPRLVMVDDIPKLTAANGLLTIGT